MRRDDNRENPYRHINYRASTRTTSELTLVKGHGGGSGRTVQECRVEYSRCCPRNLEWLVVNEYSESILVRTIIYELLHTSKFENNNNKNNNNNNPKSCCTSIMPPSNQAISNRAVNRGCA